MTKPEPDLFDYVWKHGYRESFSDSRALALLYHLDPQRAGERVYTFVLQQKSESVLCWLETHQPHTWKRILGAQATFQLQDTTTDVLSPDLLSTLLAADDLSVWKAWMAQCQRQVPDRVQCDLQEARGRTVSVVLGDDEALDVPRHVAVQIGALPSLGYRVTSVSEPYHEVFPALVDVLNHRWDDFPTEDEESDASSSLRETFRAAADYFLIEPTALLSFVGPPTVETCVVKALKAAPSWASVLAHSAMWTAQMLLPDIRDAHPYGGLFCLDPTTPHHPWASPTLLHACSELSQLEKDGLVMTRVRNSIDPSPLFATKPCTADPAALLCATNMYGPLLKVLEPYWYDATTGKPGLFVAGGSLEQILTERVNRWRNIKDIDIFLIVPTTYASDPKEREHAARDLLNEVMVELLETSRMQHVTYVRPHCSGIIFLEGYETYELQFIHRVYHTPAEVLHGFDLPSCCVGWDGKQVWMTSRAFVALVTKRNWVDPSRQSTSFEYRLTKKAYKLYIEPMIPVPRAVLESQTDVWLETSEHESPYRQNQGLPLLLQLRWGGLYFKKSVHPSDYETQTLHYLFVQNLILDGTHPILQRIYSDCKGLLPVVNVLQILRERLDTVADMRVVDPGTQHTSSFKPTRRDWFQPVRKDAADEHTWIRMTVSAMPPSIQRFAERMRTDEPIQLAEVEHLQTQRALTKALYIAYLGRLPFRAPRMHQWIGLMNDIKSFDRYVHKWVAVAMVRPDPPEVPDTLRGLARTLANIEYIRKTLLPMIQPEKPISDWDMPTFEMDGF